MTKLNSSRICVIRARGILSRAVRSALAQLFNQDSLKGCASFVVDPLESRVHLSAYDSRGKISVIVDERLFNSSFHTATEISEITASLNQYKQDLIGDGWIVSMHTNAPHMVDDDNVWNNVDENGPHAITSTTTQYRADLQTVKDMIAADFPDPETAVGAVVIVGHVTVPYSGATKYDTHVQRAMPTDQYYADLDGTWTDSTVDIDRSSFPPVMDPPLTLPGNAYYEMTPNTPGDGRFDQDAAPDNGLELAFGRIDMANLGLAFNSSEVDLLKSYFQRDHNYRTALFTPDAKALVQTDGFSEDAPNFGSVLGSSNVQSGDWLTKFSETSPTHYLFASRTGSGSLSETLGGSHPFASFNFGDATTVAVGSGTTHNTALHAVFTMVGGSYMADWNNRSFWVNSNMDPNRTPLPRAYRREF